MGDGRGGRYAMKMVLIGVAAVLLVGAGCSAAFLRGGAADTTTPTAPTTPVAAEENLVAEAQLVPVHSAALSLPSGGIVAEGLVAQGDQGQAGQGLLRPGPAPPHGPGPPGEAGGPPLQ